MASGSISTGPPDHPNCASAQLRKVRVLTVELGVDGVPGLGHQLVDEVVEIGLAVDPAVRSRGLIPADRLVPSPRRQPGQRPPAR